MSMLSIIIVNWNTGYMLKDCLHSIFNSINSFPYEITIVDNASTDNSIKLTAEFHNKINILFNRKNYGFAKANNQAIKICNGKYILLLNPDTILNGKAIKYMLDYLENNSKTGVVGCKLNNPDGSHQVGDAGFSPSISTAFNHLFLLSKFFPNYFNGYNISHVFKETNAMDVDWVSGACLMF